VFEPERSVGLLAVERRARGGVEPLGGARVLFGAEVESEAAAPFVLEGVARVRAVGRESERVEEDGAGHEVCVRRADEALALAARDEGEAARVNVRDGGAADFDELRAERAAVGLRGAGDAQLVAEPEQFERHARVEPAPEEGGVAVANQGDDAAQVDDPFAV
jgi:hypothetical protein